jgi:phage tail protein X
MTMTTETYRVATEGLSVDLLIWRRYRRKMPGLVEQTFVLNPGLAAKGPTLPVGTVVRIPVVAAPVPAIDLVRLWT